MNVFNLSDTQLATVTPNGSGGEYTEFNHPDRLGTKVITNQAGGTSYEQAALPFGTALNAESTGSTNTRFTSYDRSNATGFDYAINRTYDSKQGRFTTVDPIGMSAVSLASPQTLNMYTYCGNDPINFTDPNGLFFGKLFKWLANIFKKFGRLIIRILGHISSVANTRGSLIITNLMAGTRAIDTISAISVAILTRVAAGLYAVGAIANRFSNTSHQTTLDDIDCSIPLLTVMFIKDLSSDPLDPNKQAILLINTEIADNLTDAVLEIQSAGEEFGVSEMFRDRARQQYLWDNRNKNSNPVARPGTSNHESGFALDLPAIVRTEKVDSILRKHGFKKLANGKDPPHYEWKDAPTGAARRASNAKLNAWYLKCMTRSQE